MKQFLIVLVSTLVWATAAMGETVDQGLPQTASEQVRTSTHQAIDSGLNQDALIAMTRSMLEHNFDAEHILQAHAILMETHRQGLPVEPIMNKAHEGLAKQVSGGNVVRAMEQVRSRHAFADEHAQVLTRNKGQMARIRELMADSLAAGMHQDDAVRIMQTLQTRAHRQTQAQTEELATETLMTARELTRRGQSSAMVADAVCNGLQQGWGVQEMHQMRNTAMTNSKHNSSGGFKPAGERHGGSGGHGGSGMGGAGDHGGGGGSSGGSGGGMGGGGHM